MKYFLAQNCGRVKLWQINHFNPFTVRTEIWQFGLITRGDYKVAEMISQKSSIAINSLNLIGHPYIAFER